MLKATLPKDPRGNAINYGGTKETTARHILVDGHKGEIREAVTVAVYTGRSRTASTTYASVWVHALNAPRTSGHGKVGGYGYCKESAAIDAAIRDAGITLKEDGKPFSIKNMGRGHYEEPLKAIARAAGYRGKMELV